jgi:DNA mismatch endonuclease, patch repair protein
MPANNRSYWEGKITRNMERDSAAVQQLELAGWQVLVVWECEVEAGITMLLAILNGNRSDRQLALR